MDSPIIVTSRPDVRLRPAMALRLGRGAEGPRSGDRTLSGSDKRESHQGAGQRPTSAQHLLPLYYAEPGALEHRLGHERRPGHDRGEPGRPGMFNRSAEEGQTDAPPTRIRVDEKHGDFVTDEFHETENIRPGRIRLQRFSHPAGRFPVLLGPGRKIWMPEPGIALRPGVAGRSSHTDCPGEDVERGLGIGSSSGADTKPRPDDRRGADHHGLSRLLTKQPGELRGSPSGLDEPLWRIHDRSTFPGCSKRAQSAGNKPHIH